jgi:hypothetical protein
VRRSILELRRQRKRLFSDTPFSAFDTLESEKLAMIKKAFTKSLYEKLMGRNV